MTALVLGSRVFCYRKISADPLQPEVGTVISVQPRPDIDGKPQDPLYNVVGWTEHGSTFLMQSVLAPSDGDLIGSKLDWVCGTLVKTKAAQAAEANAAKVKAAQAKADADAKAAKDKAAVDAAAAQAAKDVPKAAQPIPRPTPAPAMAQNAPLPAQPPAQPT